MDGFNLQMPVTLVVKAPNQKIQDQTVQCGWEWTIRKLKEHLSDVYPSRPEKNHQKLIYSGKLLQDHQTLKDVLRQYDQNQTTHTVHLVCSQMTPEWPHTENKPSNVPSSSAAQEGTGGEGLRHRHHQQVPNIDPMPQAVPSPQQQVPMPQMDINAMQQMFGASAMMYGGYYPGMMAMTPEQMAWMQQMYTQQMNCLLQMYQGSMGTPPDSPATHQTLPQTPPPAPAPANQEARQDQPIRMNAQGGMALDDEDGEERHRDWLDWLYTFSRFSVLLSIVYFYSTLSRFVLVFTFFLFFYLYQGGWFNLNRNADRRQQQQQQQQQPQQPQPEPAAQPNNNEDESGGDSDRSSEEDETQGGATEPATPAPPAQPSGAQVAWTFVTSFFSSLVPQQPPPVNIN